MRLYSMSMRDTKAYKYSWKAIVDVFFNSRQGHKMDRRWAEDKQGLPVFLGVSQ